MRNAIYIGSGIRLELTAIETSLQRKSKVRAVQVISATRSTLMAPWREYSHGTGALRWTSQSWRAGAAHEELEHEQDPNACYVMDESHNWDEDEG